MKAAAKDGYHWRNRIVEIAEERNFGPRLTGRLAGEARRGEEKRSNHFALFDAVLTLFECVFYHSEFNYFYLSASEASIRL